MSGPNANLVILGGRLASEVRYGTNLETGWPQADFKIMVTDDAATRDEPDAKNTHVEFCRVIGYAVGKLKILNMGDDLILEGAKRTNEQLRIGYIEAWKVI